MKVPDLKYVLLSDVVGSRMIKDRKGFEKKLSETVQQVQQEYADVFEMPIQVWKGLDETAALIQQPWMLYNVMDRIDECIAPFKMRFVLVKGVIDVLPQQNDISKADGEAFHIAAAQMVALKKDGLKFNSSTGNDRFDKAWQGQINLLWLVKMGWTERQRSVYRLYNKTGLQEEVAKTLHISQQNVSKTLKSITAAQVQALEKNLAVWTESEFKKECAGSVI
jgi:predicted DNA-binding protein YlxM (UPF0122 family)